MFKIQLQIGTETPNKYGDIKRKKKKKKVETINVTKQNIW